MSDALDKLGKIVDGEKTEPTESSNTLNSVKRLLFNICQTLIYNSDQYDPSSSLEEIKKYAEKSPIDRILYSEISSFIVGLDENKRATVSTNLDVLITHVIDQEKNSDIRAICIKLYDHFQLNIIQLENAKVASDRAITKSIENEKIKLHDEVKRIEREYITILGIFAAIMLAFVGGFTFSTSVLSNIDKTDVQTLTLIAFIIGLVFVILLTVLIGFLREINGKPQGEKKKIYKNALSYFTIILLSVFVVISWCGRVSSNNKVDSFGNIEIQTQKLKKEENNNATILSTIPNSQNGETDIPSIEE